MLGYTQAVEGVFALTIMGSAAAMYLCARDLGGRGMALVAALVYTFLPYHLLNLYVRANLAESMAFVWLPLCLWAVRRSILTPHVRWLAASALAYGGLMLTSNLVVVLFTPALALWLLLLAWVYALPHRSTPEASARRCWARLRAAGGRALWAGLGPIAGLGLSAVFWLPAFLENRYVRVDQWFDGRYDFRGHFVYPHQLFGTSWGFGVSVPGPDDPVSLQIGLAALLLALVGLVRVWPMAGRVDGGRPRAEFLFFAGAAAAATFLSLVWAAPLWELPLIGGILQSAQFPWRWFAVMAPFMALLAGLVAWQPPAPVPAPDEPHHGLTLGLLAVAAFVLLASYPYLRVEISEPAEGPVSLASLMRFQQSSDEMTGSTAWVKKIPRWSPMADAYIRQEAAGAPDTSVTTNLDYAVFDYKTFGAESVAHNSVSEEVFFDNRDEVERALVFNRFYYPGWRAFLLDGEHGAPVREAPIVVEAEGTLGRITVPVPPGEGYLLLTFGDTPPRTVGRWISLATAALLLVLLVAAWRRDRRSRAASAASLDAGRDASEEGAE